MTYPISDVTRRVVYSGSLGAGPYPFTFEILAQGDVGVYKNTTLLTLTTDYTVTINADGTGSITLVSAATASDTVSIFGNKGIQRQTDFTTGGDLFANSLNDELDAQTIFAQQNSEAILRSIRAPVTDPTTVDMILPSASSRADSVLAFDVNGDVITTASSEFAAGISGTIIGANYVTNSATGDGSTVNFTTSVVAGAKGNIQIYIDGVYQNKSTYSISGTTVIFTEAPPLNSSIEFIIGNAIGSAVGGADEVNFTQAGTGAVTRTVESKLQDVVSVKDFGAVGDGVTDDTAAIQAAIDYCSTNGVTAFIPFGTFIVVPSTLIPFDYTLGVLNLQSVYALELKNNTRIISEGSVKIKDGSYPASTADTAMFGATDIDTVSIKGGTWLGGSTTPTSRFGILRTIDNFEVKDCNIQNFAAGVFRFGKSESADYSDNFVFESNYVEACGTSGLFYVRNGKWNNNTHVSCTEMVDLQAGCDGFVISNNVIDSPTGSDGAIEINASKNVTVTGNVHKSGQRFLLANNKEIPPDSASPVDTESRNIIIDGNKAECSHDGSSSRGGISLFQSGGTSLTHGVADAVISNNRIVMTNATQTNDQAPIMTEQAGTIIISNNMTTGGAHGYFNIVTSSGDSHDITILGNSFEDTQDTGVYARDVLGELIIANNTIKNCTNYGVYLYAPSMDIAHITDNVITTTDTGLSHSGTISCEGRITGNAYYDITTDYQVVSLGTSTDTNTLIVDNVFNEIYEITNAGVDQTVDHKFSKNVVLNPASATNYIEALRGYEGQHLTLIANNGNSTITHNSSSATNRFLCAGSADAVLTSNSTITFVMNSSRWREVSRSIA